MSILKLIVPALICTYALSASSAYALDRKDIVIRDPYILYEAATCTFYMYGTITRDGQLGFDVYETKDPTLQTWNDPKPVFRRPEGFWGDRDYWAPEVHRYRGKYYMFATFGSADRVRGIQILVSDSPAGPFTIHSPEPVTSPDYNALDGTLYIDKKGNPWLIYSREWVSVHDGEMRAVRLKSDLSGVLEGAEDILLFKASSAPWVSYWNDEKGVRNWLTDGPHMLRMINGDLVMIWSSNVVLPPPINWGYAVGVARSVSGDINGPWVNEKAPLYNGFAGHGMIFRHPTQGLVLSVHQPNYGSAPYPMFLLVSEVSGKLTMADPAVPKYVLAYWRFEDCTPEHAVLPSIDILDSSGRGNHLRGKDFNSAGSGSANVPAQKVRANNCPNYACYDNSASPDTTAGIRFLGTANAQINSAHLKAWTIEASICPLQFSDKRQVFVGKICSAKAYTGGVLHFCVTPEQRIEIQFTTQDKVSVSLTSHIKVVTGKWYNLAAVSDGKMLRLYVGTPDGNGYKLDNSIRISGPNTSIMSANSTWTVGCGTVEGKLADQFFGRIDEVRISDKALSPKDLLFQLTTSKTK